MAAEAFEAYPFRFSVSVRRNTATPPSNLKRLALFSVWALSITVTVDRRAMSVTRLYCEFVERRFHCPSLTPFLFIRYSERKTERLGLSVTGFQLGG
jgi:hypothetical protein